LTLDFAVGFHWDNWKSYLWTVFPFRDIRILDANLRQSTLNKYTSRTSGAQEQ